MTGSIPQWRPSFTGNSSENVSLKGNEDTVLRDRPHGSHYSCFPVLIWGTSPTLTLTLWFLQVWTSGMALTASIMRQVSKQGQL
ncbi:Uncharacterized protein DAT39_019309 [Clarias magur]|uniref:Uncharacterized protein n=1 Tax=Clarias magur TaxID=1594786 RepID=A0A8J4TI60_CLAMG|nr:Uncharacterized protein DAT39_019309 [Clarias magur]